jgi:pilus assembly protein CpaE
MYGVVVTLIGCNEQILPPAARDILRRWALVDVDYPSVTALQKNVLAKEGETRLLILHVASAGDVSELKRLNLTYPRFPILAVVDATSDPTLVMKSLRAGALQVVHPPVLADDLQEALDCIAAKHEGRQRLARMITVTGAVGGCGATTVAITLAQELARLTKSCCILIEVSFRKGAVANHLGITPRYTTAALVSDIQRVDSFVLQGALTEVADNFCVLAGPYETIQTETTNVDAAMKMIELSRHLSTWVVLDMPSTYDELYFRSLTAADQIVLVAEQSVAAIRGAQLVCETLGKQRPMVAIDRYNAKTSGLSAESIQKFIPGCEICTLTNDPAVGASTNSGLPLYLYSQHSPVLNDLYTLIKKLETDARMDGQQRSMLKRLGRALSLN